MWTQDAIKRLMQDQNEQRSVNLLNRMSKMSKTERMAVFHKLREDRDHEDKMRPTVNTHLRHLADGVNDDLARDAFFKRQLEARKSKNRSLQGSGAKFKDSGIPMLTPGSCYAKGFEWQRALGSWYLVNARAGRSWVLSPIFVCNI
ncbi:hypothetical protein BGZ83_003756 [Gryganskiella cystojenkinii]|nr:hypothetical protein BGZ83_003756 [Gryganskiella cystojenkinii]